MCAGSQAPRSTTGPFGHHCPPHSVVWLGLIFLQASQGLNLRAAFSCWFCSSRRAARGFLASLVALRSLHKPSWHHSSPDSVVAVTWDACSLPTARVAEGRDVCQSMAIDAGKGNVLSWFHSHLSVNRRKSPATSSWQQLWGDPEKGRSRQVVSVLALSISDLWEPDHFLMQNEAGCHC